MNSFPQAMPEWSKEEVQKTYLYDKWGSGHFDVSPEGELLVTPKQDKSFSISIPKVVEEIKAQGIQFPAVIRFHDILHSRVQELNNAFIDAIKSAAYAGKYTGVYPIKVNQMREVVEEILQAGKPYDFGLEAGSKAELISVLAYNTNPAALTILNGYKDDEYLKLALLGRKIGRKIIIVIERMSELKQLIKLSKELEVIPLIGLRTKLSVKCEGRWSGSGGERAKFGLTTSEILSAIEYLKENNYLDSCILLHFHLGSQITDIRHIKDAISEGSRIYAKLKQLNVPLQYLDVGGGLGIDYEGNLSARHSSTNYTIGEYASDIVWGIKQICELEKVAVPNIVSESGRSITAHHSCIITNVVGVVKTAQTSFDTKQVSGEHILVENMRDVLEELTADNYQEMYNDAIKIKEDAICAFNLGVFNLSEKAKVETLYWQIAQKINLFVEKEKHSSDELLELQDSLTDQYLCNFSVFQSTADSWAIGQLLPIMPIARLNERPRNWCSIGDITCDSDGKIDKFIDIKNNYSKKIPLHELTSEDDYYIGIFLTGAYQDVMGDMHNLFGRLNEVHVYADEKNNDFYIEEVIPGNKIKEVLSTMQYSPNFLSYRVKKAVDDLVTAGEIAPREGVKWVDFYDSCLESYTYLS